MPGPSQSIDAKTVYSQQFRASEVRTWSTYWTVGPAPLGEAGRGKYARHHHCARAASVAGGSAGFWTVGEPAAARARVVSKAHAARPSDHLVLWRSGRLLGRQLRSGRGSLRGHHHRRAPGRTARPPAPGVRREDCRPEPQDQMGRRESDRSRHHLHRDERAGLLLRTAGRRLSGGSGYALSSKSRAPAAGLLADTPISRIWAPYQRLLHTFEQLRFIERLAQKTDCSGLHRSLSSLVLWKGSNENDRRAVAVSNQVVLQLHTVHTGHLHIRNDAGRFAQSGRGQEFFRRSKRVYRKSHRPQQPGCRGTHRSIVVDDRDYRDLCHAT